MNAVPENVLASDLDPAAPEHRADAGLEFRGVDERGAQVLLFLGGSEGRTAENAYAAFEDRFRVALLRSPLPDMTHVISTAERVERSLSVVGTKRTTVIGMGPGTPLAQALTAHFPDVVRRLVLVNATARVSPTLLLRCIDRIEMFLPLGLPLRPLSSTFDSRPLLHRIRCPALVLTGPSAGRYVSDQSDYLARKIPNARRELLREEPWTASGTMSTELTDRVLHFLQIAAKKPQKNTKPEARR